MYVEGCFFLCNFEFTKDELLNWRSQSVTSNSVRMGIRYAPMVFIEQGVAMLSSVLRSDRSIAVNIQIMRTFTQLRNMNTSLTEVKDKVACMEKQYDKQFKVVFTVLKQFLESEDSSQEQMGFAPFKKKLKLRSC